MATILAFSALAMFLLMASGMVISLNEIGRVPAFNKAHVRTDGSDIFRQTRY
jgi:hypothetical protein